MNADWMVTVPLCWRADPACSADKVVPKNHNMKLTKELNDTGSSGSPCPVY